jgi:hypothetical protein
VLPNLLVGEVTVGPEALDGQTLRGSMNWKQMYSGASSNGYCIAGVH